MGFVSAPPALPSALSRPLALPTLPVDRRIAIVAAVLGFHVLALWALQTGLLHRAAQELVVQVSVLAEAVTPPLPQVAPASPSPEPRPALAPKPAAPRKPTFASTPPPAPVESFTPPAAPVASPEPPAQTTPVMAAAPPAVSAPPAPLEVEQPSSSAAYLNNPPPPYPAMSRRLHEQGKVVVRVFIDASGGASQAQIVDSSGFERLDEAALRTALRWRYVPGKRGGVPEGMWFNVPIRFVLE